mmetsp:Transcript_14574/g.29565  ORF Transcript_14574/g.29565 Transcript_14574/m.29565 type:complete len:127 (-) Transcript_14574:3421-3801(-)
MNVETIDNVDDNSLSTDSQVTDDPELKDSKSGHSTNDSSASSEEAKFVKKESQHVFYLRVLVLLILFSASAAISLVVYFVTEAGERDSFETRYYAAADKVSETFHSIATEKMEAAGSIIGEYASYF